MFPLQTVFPWSRFRNGLVTAIFLPQQIFTPIWTTAPSWPPQMQCSPVLASQRQNKRLFSPMISPREKGENVKKVAELISVGSNKENNSRKCLNRTWQFRHFLHKLAEWVGFEPTVPLPVHLISSQGRYNHFDTTPYLSQHDFISRNWKTGSEKTENLGRFRGEND